MDDGPGASEPHEGEPEGISSGPGRENALNGVQMSLSDHQREQLPAEVPGYKLHGRSKLCSRTAAERWASAVEV